MQLSIIIVSYNTKKLTLQCIKSIYESKPSVDFEVIVVDNASSDGSEKDLGKLGSNYKNYKFIQNKTNSGFSKGNNIGIKHAKGKYILLLNSDTEVKKNAIDLMYKYATSSKEIGVVGAKLLNPDGSVQASALILPTIEKTIRTFWLGEKNLNGKYVPSEDEPTEVEVLVMAAFMITPTALEKVGKLDERYFMYFEDIDYCRRIKEKGLKIVYLPTAEIIHYHGSSGKNIVDEKNQWKRLIPSAKIYYGTLGYYVQWFITRTGQIFGN